MSRDWISDEGLELHDYYACKVLFVIALFFLIFDLFVIGFIFLLLSLLQNCQYRLLR